jgi:xenotropic and polytropic retrovirus receptor 1
MDWSLCNPVSPHRFLRDVLAFRRVWVYYVAMVADVVIRFNWIFYAIFLEDIQHSALLSFVISLTEVCRRAVWTIFRVENEHCTNVYLFRASRDVPLPYNLSEPISPAPMGEAEPTTLPLAEQSPPLAAVAQDIETARSDRLGLGLRARHPKLSRTMSRIGTLMTTAHIHDFQRKKRNDPLSGSPVDASSQHLDDDSTDDDEDELNHADEDSHDDDALIPSPTIFRTQSRTT